MTDAKGSITHYQYNGNNELIQETLPDGNTTLYIYDTRGNPRTKTDPNGTITTYTYDALDRIIRKDYTLASGVGGVTYETYTYDARGYLISTTNSLGISTTHTYDLLGNLTSESNGGKTLNSTYDALGNRLTLTTPSGRTYTSTYDTSDRMTSILEGSNPLATYTYDALHLTRETTGNGVSTDFTYDQSHRLSSLATDSFVYDANSNILRKGSATYTYDPYNQLTQALYGDMRFGTGMQGNAYDYDLMGNRESEHNIRFITKTNKKTGTTTEIQRNKVWDYTTNTLNQYLDVLAQSGTLLISSGSTSS